MAGQIGIGYGSTLEVNDGASAAYVEISEPKMIDLPEAAAPQVDATPLNGTSGYRRKVPGLMEFTPMVFESYYTIENFIRLEGLKRTRKTWRITDPDNGTIVYDGALSKNGVGFNVDDMMVIKSEVIVYDEFVLAVAP